jgi:hypothetical protein
MTYRTVVVAVLALGLVLLPAAPASAQAPQVQVTLAQREVAVGVGDRLGIEALIVNAGDRPSEPLVAHLNVATLDTGVYVDLEDWTAGPTQGVEPLDPGGSTTLRWVIQAVNVGRFNVYVVVMPRGGVAAAPTPLTASPPEVVAVAGRRTISAGGALPVALLVPLLVGVVAVAARWRPWSVR